MNFCKELESVPIPMYFKLLKCKLTAKICPFVLLKIIHLFSRNSYSAGKLTSCFTGIPAVPAVLQSGGGEITPLVSCCGERRWVTRFVEVPLQRQVDDGSFLWNGTCRVLPASSIDLFSFRSSSGFKSVYLFWKVFLLFTPPAPPKTVLIFLS